jgi:tetratricopeptide (TPR) repeat protein
MKIRALNEPEVSISTSDESSNDDGRQQTLSKEALEDQYFEKYRQALFAIQEGKKDKAKDLLEELEDELETVDTNSNNDNLLQLKFSVLRNLGNLVTDDIDHYIEALELDSTDISLWIKSGDRSAKLNNLSFARICYEQALTLNSNNWVAIDRLLELYFILHLPFELYDMCLRALSLNRSHKKANLMLKQAENLLPMLDTRATISDDNGSQQAMGPLLALKRKRQYEIQADLQKFKRAKLGITLDTARTQSLASFGNYIIKIYERFSKQCITRNTMIDITLNNTSSFSQQFCSSINSQSNQNQNSSDPQTITCSQDIEMVVMDGECGTSNNQTEKINDNRTAHEHATTSTDDNDQTKSNGRSTRSNQASQSSNTHKNSSLSFAAMLFPTDLHDKRRSSRNRSNQDDTFSFKMKFDELNDLLPECLRICALEQALQRRREEHQLSNDAARIESEHEESISIETNMDPVREDQIIKDVIKEISGHTQANGVMISNIRLCDMFYVYLSKLAAKKQNSLPEAFIKIYKIYRRLCPLPTGVFIEIGKDGIELDELWFTLAANEIVYQYQECAFLLRILEQLQIHLDEAQHKEMLVRLFLVMGLNEDYKYLEVALQNIEEDARIYASDRKIITRAHIKTLIDRKTEKLQQEIPIEDSDNSVEIIDRLAPKSENEMSDREIQLLCNAIKSAKLWQRGLNILNHRNDLNSDIIIETINLCLKNGAVMDAILSSKLCKEAISGTRPTTWSCLFRGWKGVLSEDELKSEKTIDAMDKFFELGHQTLGKKNSCTIDNGEFLMLYVEHLLSDDRESFEERDLFGATYCLFSYPNKRPASVANHKAVRAPMEWDYAKILYPYLVPDELPTYMSLLRKVGITSELEVLFREIAEATPVELNPKRSVHIIENFIELGEPISDPAVEKSEVTQDLYYFLADYYFKNKDFTKAKLFYHYDLVINPDRFDSWAASGLIRASSIDKALSEGAISTQDFVGGFIRNLADAAIRCFEQATHLKPDEPKATLWIEFGNLTYNLMSLASRLYIYDDFDAEYTGKTPACVDELVECHRRLYELTKRCFTSANELCLCDEVWLHYYMLGKIYEKADPLRAIEYYHKADAQLFLEGASYPRKISYHNPPDLAYEAMEVHYRIHAAALKWLFSSKDQSQSKLNKLRRTLLNAQRSPFVLMENVYSDRTKSWMVEDEYLHKDIGLLLNDVIDSVTRDATSEELVYMCLHGMKRCLVRCDKNFKALYRLSFYYRNIKRPQMAQQILLSREISTDDRIQRRGLPEFMAGPPDLKGVDSLFKDRKNGNLFFNIWRMPIEEIDRPGCFEHWMFKCTWLLINICADLKDTNMLTTIASQLSRQPETAKRYLQDRPRVLLAQSAVRLLAQLTSPSSF